MEPDIFIRQTFPLSPELNDALAVERDEEARMQELANHDSKRDRCRLVVKAGRSSYYRADLKKLWHSGCKPDQDELRKMGAKL